uniref:hypothetical protein n=1 Tax=Escherichia coli TaxID=562 RepID=UPI0015C4F672
KENHRYVRCVVNPDYDGISLELGLNQAKDDLKVVMSILNNSQTSEAADQIYIWFNVNSGYLFSVAKTSYAPSHNINSNSDGIYRTAFKVDKQ